jgi:hypothetical protein
MAMPKKTLEVQDELNPERITDSQTSVSESTIDQFAREISLNAALVERHLENRLHDLV